MRYPIFIWRILEVSCIRTCTTFRQKRICCRLKFMRALYWYCKSHSGPLFVTVTVVVTDRGEGKVAVEEVEVCTGGGMRTFLLKDTWGNNSLLAFFLYTGSVCVLNCRPLFVLRFSTAGTSPTSLWAAKKYKTQREAEKQTHEEAYYAQKSAQYTVEWGCVRWFC